VPIGVVTWSYFWFCFTLLFPTEFEDDPDLYVLKPIKYVGIEVWQVCVYTFCSFSIDWRSI